MADEVKKYQSGDMGNPFASGAGQIGYQQHQAREKAKWDKLKNTSTGSASRSYGLLDSDLFCFVFFAGLYLYFTLCIPVVLTLQMPEAERPYLLLFAYVAFIVATIIYRRSIIHALVTIAIFLLKVAAILFVILFAFSWAQVYFGWV